MPGAAEAGSAQGGGHAPFELAEPGLEQGGGHVGRPGFVEPPPEGGAGSAPGGGVAAVGGEAGWGQGGGQARLGADVFGQDGAAMRPAPAVARPAPPAAVVVDSAAVVVVDAAVVGGDSGAIAASVPARSSPGRTSPTGTGTAAEEPSESVATDTALGDPMSAWETARAESTITMLVSTASSIRGDKRLTQRRCTVFTSAPPGSAGRRTAPDPQPVRLDFSNLVPGWWRLLCRINRHRRENFADPVSAHAAMARRDSGDGMAVRRDHSVPSAIDRAGGPIGALSAIDRAQDTSADRLRPGQQVP